MPVYAVDDDIDIARGIQVEAPVPILSNKKKMMIGIILVCVPVGFIVRASLSKLF